nr:IclR family transcriptional regulator C-terminal domain-containing protein [Limobrevibacterium gyesilva]
MQDLRARVKETILLGVLAQGSRVRALAKEVSPLELRYDADLGHLRPAYCTAMGRLLLAHLPPAQWRRALLGRKLRALTPHTVTDSAALEAILARVRQDGYATIEQQYVLGGSGVAAPVVDAEGQVVAALNIASVSSRFDHGRDRLIQGAVEAARRVSRRLHDAGQ